MIALFQVYPASAQEHFSAIAPGEKLTITVVEQEDLDGVYAISSEGTLAFPLIDERLFVAGSTYEELALMLKERLEEKYFYVATVSVTPSTEKDVEEAAVEVNPGVVYVYGMVGSPGVVKIPEDETLTVGKVIIRSGGFKEFSNKKKVKLIRKSNESDGAQVTILNLVNIIDRGKLEEDVEVQDGDIIVVPEKFFNF